MDFHQVRESKRWNYFADPLILRGYRVSSRKREVLWSLFELHNETLNVWVHLIGAIVFVSLFGAWITSSNVPLAWSNDIVVVEPICPAPPNYANHWGSYCPAGICESDALEKKSMLVPNANRVAANSMFFVPSSRHLSATVSELNMAFGVLASMTHKLDELMKEAYDGHDMHLWDSSRLDTASAIARGKHWLAEFSSELKAGAAFATCRDCATRLWNETATKLVKSIDNMREKSSVYAEEFSRLESSVQEEVESLFLAFEAAVSELSTTMPHIHDVPTWPLMVFCFCGFTCLLSSTLYHMFMGFDRCTFHLFCRVDLAGISAMILGSFFPPIVYVFHCDALYMVTYLVSVAVASAGTLAFCFLPDSYMHLPRVRLARTMSYVFAGLIAFLPFVHILIRWGYDSEQFRIFVADGYLYVVGCLYLLGTFLYISRYPEKLFPGKFDLFFASHQLWHICVLLASVVHYYNVVAQYHWRKLNPICNA
mmetsp:Transcript_14270/g.22546  ORF Transcript_14270/g.22546 Transcript_14270/m.22546 type:complete len:482 (-) Transcript_14270:98-1543(-)